MYPPEAEIVTIDPYLPPANPVFAVLVEDDKLQVGTVLVRSPFGTGMYASAQEAPLAFEQEKVHLMADYAGFWARLACRLPQARLKLTTRVPPGKSAVAGR